MEDREKATRAVWDTYSFDDYHIGLLNQDGQSLATKTIPLPTGVSRQAWYSHAGNVVQLLNKIVEERNALRARAEAAEARADSLEDKLAHERALTDGAHRRAREAQVERDRLREALMIYASGCDGTETHSCGYEGSLCCKTARAALSNKEGE